MQQLLNDAKREVVADVVNAALLASATGKPKWEVKPQVRRTAVDGNMLPCFRLAVWSSNIVLMPLLHFCVHDAEACGSDERQHILGPWVSLGVFHCMSSTACYAQFAIHMRLDCCNKVCAC